MNTAPLIRDVAGLARLRTRQRRLLAVFPHPDDEAYGCAGALAREGAREDGAAALLCLTRGEASTVYAARGLNRAQIGAMREERLEQVAAITGMDGLLVPGLPDGRLAREPLDAVAAVVREAVEAMRPQVVIIHCPRGVNGHADHIATHWAVRRALESLGGAGLGGARLAMLVYPREVSEALAPRLLFWAPDEEIDVVLDLSREEADAKERSLRVHEALVTLVDGGDPGLLKRPPVERYDLLGEDLAEPAADLFTGIC